MFPTFGTHTSYTFLLSLSIAIQYKSMKEDTNRLNMITNVSISNCSSFKVKKITNVYDIMLKKSKSIVAKAFCF